MRWQRRLLTESGRQWIAAAVAIGPYAVVYSAQSDLVLSSMVYWNCYALAYLAISVVLFRRTASADVAARLAADRPSTSRWRRWLFSRNGIRSFTVLVSFYALLAAAWVLPRRNELLPEAPWLLGSVAVLTVVTSWTFIHVVFTQLYASQYYSHADADAPLNFPGSERPDYLDFAYFAFSIGTTFGTTDVTVLTSRFRRTVLAHAVFSFAFNTLIIGLTITFLLGT